MMRAAWACGLAGALALPATANAEPVRTATGLVEGAPGRSAAVTVFKGIPYAGSAAGAMRWRPPASVEPWKGVRKADSFGPICLQRMPPQARAQTSTPASEDCLSLNVWTASAGKAAKRPVLVWIHGGRFIFGAGSQSAFDGEALAQKGVVVVTINYRLGVFGFLATPELSRESGHNASGNYALLDQIAALKWVRGNIAAFGGDPARVTIAGQSAGASSVLQLIDSPLAKGLFTQAIAESGALYPNDPLISGLAPSWRPLKTAEEQGQAYAERAGAYNLAELRALPAEALMAENNKNDEALDGRPPLFRPVVDGWVVPRSYGGTLRSGTQNQVTLLTGYNLDEAGAEAQTSFTLDSYKAAVAKKYGAMADEFLRLYPATTDAQATPAWKAAARDSARVSSWHYARLFQQHGRKPVYTYYWTHAPGSAEGQRRGAYHESEIAFVFDSMDAVPASWTVEDRRIAGLMSSYWASFISSGNPNGAGLAPWAQTGAARQVMELGERFGPRPLADATRQAFFERYFADQPSW